MVTGLWWSGPGTQESWAVVSVSSPTTTPSGAPGDPDKDRDGGGGQERRLNGSRATDRKGQVTRLRRSTQKQGKQPVPPATQKERRVNIHEGEPEILQPMTAKHKRNVRNVRAHR